jgi:hypothetical protein
VSASAWSPRDATDHIRRLAKAPSLELIYKKHASERLAERNIILSDVLYVLKNGFVLEEAVPALRQGFYKYLVQSKSPNSGSRALGVIVIPEPAVSSIKVVTIMWMDERERKDGTLIGGEDGEH